MEKKLTPKKKPQTHNFGLCRVNRLVLILILIVVALLSLACTIGWGLDFSDGEPYEEQAENEHLIRMLTKGSEVSVTSAPPAAVEPEPIHQPVIPSASEAESVVAGANEYSVASNNFDCICQETGIVTEEFKFVGEQLELGGQIYDKISDNTYKRNYMGYYILVSGEGDQKTETQVDEEQSTIIILTDTGFVMEHYKGEGSSPCCFYTFTKND